jgi:2-polyprenyl-3-methyl-5-hydroxy-6-metoxy-1,4-benzoquinol methylase
MNRKARRSEVARAGFLPALIGSARRPQAPGIDDIYAAVTRHYRAGGLAEAQRLCRAILARDPRHLRSLVTLADIVQQEGRNNLALKLLKQALAVDCADATAHDTIAMTYQALGRRDEAVWHFTQALALGLRGAETLVKQNTALSAALRRLAEAWPRQLSLADLLGPDGAVPLAADALLLALLQSTVIHERELERLFTATRRALLEQVVETGAPVCEGSSIEFYCALAQQCFLNEYVFAAGAVEETRLACVHNRVVEALRSEVAVAPLDLTVIASYQPLHELPLASSLLDAAWPDGIGRLLTQQIREPFEEAADRPQIPAVTSVADAASLQVQDQYETSPYPRWTAVPQIKPTTVVQYLRDSEGIAPASWPITKIEVSILIAGCGTGSHSIDSALRFPRAHILAIDLSRASLAYARRKSRALGLTNVEYAQADILQLGSLERRFDVIEAVGVLHHLSDPEAGWRLLLSLLRPNGLMCIGLYSEAARRSLAAGRALIAERGYRATAADIRAFRQELMWRNGMPPFRDFSSISGCRDLLFHVIEHQFNIPRIATFIETNQLMFLGFASLPPEVSEQFRQLFPNPAAPRDLACWHAFEQMHPHTFGGMYSFWVQKIEAAGKVTERPASI